MYTYRCENILGGRSVIQQSEQGSGTLVEKAAGHQ